MKTLASGLLLTLWLWQLAGCGDESSLVGEPLPNTPPDTEITSTPPHLGRTASTITFYWKGTDNDGDVVAFEWRISDNGRDGIVDVGDTLQSKLPWHRTTATDSTFSVSAAFDSLDVDVADPDLEPGEYRFWETHTFFVRAVDNGGLHDPTPASASFTATTLAPTVIIDVPQIKPSITCTASARVLTFGWRTRDPDSVPPVPAFTRWILFPFEGTGGQCATQGEYEREQPIRADNPLWSDWVAYDAPGDSGVSVTLPRHDAGRKFLFAVQARDAAGAVTPNFDWNRNVRYVEVTDGKLPLLTVNSTISRNDLFVGTGKVKSIEILEVQPLQFDWSADATDYAGVIDAYRYGWNVNDPNDPNDAGWAVAWGDGPEWRHAGPLVFGQGSPNLIIQCRDNSGAISRAYYQFQVIPFIQRSSQRNILVVDDFPNSDTSSQQALEILWDRGWEDMFRGEVVGFGSGDMIDAQKETRRLGFATVNNYKAVVWFTGPSELTYFHTNLTPTTLGAFRLNWLEIYQKYIGNILFCGSGAMYNTVERGRIFGGGGHDWLFPIVFDVSAGGDFGFGTAYTADGRQYNVGTTRWPYSGWCLEAIDQIRPTVNRIYGESPGHALRSWECDSIIRADVSDAFLAAYPDAAGRVVTLRPTQPRKLPDREYQPEWEEFYNVNTTNRPVFIGPRPCQVPMYTLRARRDEGYVEDPKATCWPRNREVSSIDGLPIAIVSTAYAETKALKGSPDFLWGFHPMSFEFDDVRAAALWIAETRWQLPMQR